MVGLVVGWGEDEEGVAWRGEGGKGEGEGRGLGLGERWGRGGQVGG